jgi:hypothetical protein
MSNEVIFYELKRPNSSIPWAHEYIINCRDEELNDVVAQYHILRQERDGRNGYQDEILYTDNVDIIHSKVTFFNATPESVNHIDLLQYRRLLPLISKYWEWSIQYNKMYGIIKTKLDTYNTPENSILNYGDYGSVDLFGLKFQNPVLDQNL